MAATRDVERVLTSKDGHAVDLIVPRTTDVLRRALEPLARATVVGCDVETTGVRPIRDLLLTVGIGARYEDGGAYVVVIPYSLVRDHDPQIRDLAWDALFSRTRRTVFQNGKFDLQFLSLWFDSPTPEEALLGDTLLLGYLIDERPRKDRIGSLGLKEQAAYRYDEPDYHWDWERFYADMAHDGFMVRGHYEDECQHPHPDPVVRADWDGLHTYQAIDVYNTLRLWDDAVEEAQAESERLLECHDQVLIPASIALSKCELVGAPLDFDWIHEFSSWLTRRITVRESALMKVGRELGADETMKLGSPAKVADLMYDVWSMKPDMRRRKRTSEGLQTEDRSTDKEHIEAAIAKYFKSGTPLQRRGARWLRTLLRWRGDTKMMSTYSESLVDKADGDKRVRASFMIHGTSTGRISSSAPNLQNIPAVTLAGEDGYVERRSGKPTRWPARRAFAPGDGYLFMEADFSQLELRVAAALSGDEAFGRVFVEGRDIHLEVAATMFSKPPEQVTKPERFLAKAVDFGILYGRTAKALVNGVEMDFLERELHGKRWDEPTAQAFINKFLRSYPQLRDWIKDTGERALVDHYVESPFGRRRRFPLTPRNRYERLAIMRQAVNTPIQSAASDICLMAMSRIIPRLPYGADVLFPVHDSICLELREDLLDEVTSIVREEMEVEFMGVPLEIDVESGPSWADVH